MTPHEKVIEAAKNFCYEGKNFRVVNHHSEFLNRSLYLINFECEDEPKHCFVYVEGSQIEVCKNQALLNELVARKSKKIGFAAVLSGLGGISGIIGLIITLTIVYLVISNPKAEVPQILSTALTAILGLYFGSKSSKQ